MRISRPPAPESRFWVALCAAAVLAGIWVYHRLSELGLTSRTYTCPRPGIFAYRQAVANANAGAAPMALMMAGRAGCL
jgi:hypothetical protein